VFCITYISVLYYLHRCSLSLTLVFPITYALDYVHKCSVNLTKVFSITYTLDYLHKFSVLRTQVFSITYGVATVSRIDQIIGLFCRISSVLEGSFAKKTSNFIDPTNRSHPIHTLSLAQVFCITYTLNHLHLPGHP